MSSTHIFNVEMTCEGCSGAVERVLNRLKGQGVSEVSVSLPEQKVSVTSSLSADQLLDVIKKTGKRLPMLEHSNDVLLQRIVYKKIKAGINIKAYNMVL